MDSGAKRAMEEGYIPHNKQSFTCPNCGWDTFKSFPQSVSMDAKVWGFEHECERCGHIVTIYIKRD